MPRVPKIDELHIARQGIDAPEFRPVQGQHVQPVQGMDAQRLRMQRTEDSNGMAPVRFERAIQASDMPSRQLQAMGQAMASWGDLIREIGLRESEEVDRARVQEGINRYMEQSLDAQQNQDYGWQTMQGANALGDKDKGDLATQRAARMKPVREQLLQNLGNERQKEAFVRLADEEDARANELIGRHVLRESEKNKREQLGAGVAIAGKMMMGGEEERQAAFAKINEHVAQLAQMDGLSGEALIAKQQELASPYVRAVIAERINAYDREGSARMLAEYEDYLTAGDKVELMSAYKTMHEVQTAREAAEAEFSDGDVQFEASKTGDPYAAYNQGFNDANYRQKAFGVESGDKANAQNPDSTAYGYAQALSGTWLMFGDSAVGRQLRGGMSKEQWLALRTDKAHADAFMDWYRDESIAHFRKAGVPVNDTTMYLAHFLGWHGAAKVYNAPPGTANGAVIDNYQGKKGVYASNKSVMDKAPTTDKLVAWAAGKMGVKPTGELPTGQPQRPVRMSNAQVRERAQELYPNNPTQQRNFIDLYATKRDVEAAAQQTEYNGHLNTALDVVFSGGNVSQIPPQAWAALSAEDQNKIMRQRESTYNLEQSILERENLDLFMRLSNSQELGKISEEDIRAARLDLGDKYTQELLNKKRALEKAGADSARQMTLEDTVIKNLIAELGVIDPWELKGAEDKKAMDYAVFNIRQSINYHVTQHANAGIELTQEKLIELVRADISAKVVEYRENWRGKRVGEEKPAVFQPPTHGLYQDRSKLGMWRTDY